jgi:hypothetical protein
MRNYKALKSASKVSVQKVEVVDQVKVDEVKDEDGEITTHARAKQSHEELQVVCKKYDPHTGEAQDDVVTEYQLSALKSQIDHCKSQVAKLQAEQADLEQLETDLKAL